MNPHHYSTVLDGLRHRLGDSVTIHHEPGVDACRTAHPLEARCTRPGDPSCGDTGLAVAYFDNRDLAGDPVIVERAGSGRLIWLGEPGHGLTAASSA